MGVNEQPRLVNDAEEWQFATRAVHAGWENDPATGAVVPPIHMATTYEQEAPAKHRGFEYSRSGNPTRAVLERTLAELEGGRFGFAFASGLAAEDALLRTVTPGAHIVIPHDAYGGTYRLAARVHDAVGLRFTAVDLSDTSTLEGAIEADTELVWCESPTNPTLSTVDIAAVAEIAHERGAVLVVDNTFATPVLQQPLTLGADVVVHSSTKYLGGHSDVVGGAAITNDEPLAERIGFLQNAAGAVPSPFDCWLLVRGLRTLAIRVERQQENARAVAAFLETCPSVASVLYPGFGGMVSFLAAGGEDAAVNVCIRTKLFTLAESLGAVESLIEHPARMTHASVAGTTNEVDPALVRVSCGIEAADDLIADLAQALG
ncbi:MAG TPA: aminotransferase class I/II-fold pyridoxal phosphate-dependent enzyme [Acidimicrobiales bacterium]|nr:aminotransferase class I/II-fold pyridoxal phosphate-dependent enzyme [Acidimicrobiales bacterium]